MANIKVGELRDYKKEFNKDVDIVKVGKLEIEVKQYLPIGKKIELVSSIYGSCNDDNNGLLIVNNNSKEIAKVYFITKYYTNISLGKDIFDAYDLLIETEIYKAIEKNISEEINRIEEILENMIKIEYERYNQENTYQKIIKNGINDFNNNLIELIKRIPTQDEVKEIIGKVDKLDVDKLGGVVKGLFFNNGVDGNGIQNK